MGRNNRGGGVDFQREVSEALICQTGIGSVKMCMSILGYFNYD